MMAYPMFLAVLAISFFPWFYIILPTGAFVLMLILYTSRQRRYGQTGNGKMASYRKKLELLYKLVDSMPDWIYIKDRDSRFILANKHMANYHGISDPDEMTGRTDYDYYPEEMARAFYEDEQKIMGSGEPIVNKEEKIQDAGGNEAILSTTKLPVRDKAGNTIGIIGIGRNIARQKKDQMRLKELSMVASGTENVVVIMDADGNFEWVNRGFEDRYGSTLEEFVKKKGRNLRESSSKEGIEEILDQVKRTGKPQTYISRMQNADSMDAWSQTNITPVLNEEGGIISMFLIDSDITALKKADLQIKQQKYQLESQRDELRKLNARKDRLFSIIAHDLKNPFQSIIGFSELLTSGYQGMKKKQVEEYLECIHSSSTSAYDLLYNLLEWARAQTNSIQISPVQIGIRDLVGEVLDLFCAQALNKEIALKNEIEPGLKAVADLNMLQTILRNLVANAIKYTGQNGTVTLTAKLNDKYVDLSVADNGVGMPEEKIKTLFSLEKGRSTPGTSGEKGTGLGLLVCYEFLELNKGYFQVESVPDKGSVFTISLPLES